MIPVSQNLNQVIPTFSKGNYSLWFNKFIALEQNTFKPIGGENAKDKIQKKYEKIHTNNLLVNSLLQKKHQDQISIIKSFSVRYHAIEIWAQLTSRLISGLGQSHPTETGMVLDHNLGIPYIPAASVKGLVKASRRLNINLSDETGDDDESTLLPNIFGVQQRIGGVIFMDAYPAQIPNLELDIMTPHYGDYYKEGSHEWPGDWMTPTPIKFLTVAKDTVFVFRALVNKEQDANMNGALVKAVKKAYKTALTIEGVGAKTAVGYGRFKLLVNVPIAQTNTDGDNATLNFYEKPDGTKEYYLQRIKNFGSDLEKMKILFQKWENDSKWKSDKEIAQKLLLLLPQKKKRGGRNALL